MQARASCPGTNQVINPVDMFILKRRTGGGDYSRCTPDNERQLAAQFYDPPFSRAESGASAFSSTLGLPCSLARNLGGRKDDLTTSQPAVCLLCDINSQVPRGQHPGSCTKCWGPKCPSPPRLQAAHHLCAEVFSGCLTLGF